MKSECQNSNNNSDPIWTSNVELLSEECLPIIGGCQISSLLQNLDNSQNDHNLQNMDLIILHGNDDKLQIDAPLNLHTNSYIVLKDSGAVEICSNSSSSSLGNCHHKLPDKYSEKINTVSEESVRKTYSKAMPPNLEELRSIEPTDLSLSITDTSNCSNTSSISPKHYDKESFEDMLYFVCNLCPFLCTKESKITEHLESVHKNKTSSKLVQLKCPACANIFYHRASLKSHLLHDHCVASGDLNLIVQAVMFYSNKENKKEKDSSLDTKQSDKLETALESVQEKIVNNSSRSEANNSEFQFNNSNLLKNKENDVATLNKSTEKSKDAKLCEPQLFGGSIVPQKVLLPQVDLTADVSEKLISNLMKKTDPVVKYVYSQKCAYSSCKVMLGDNKKMDYHIQSHWNDGFKCLECQEKFVMWKPLTSHLWRMHKIDMELFPCDKCDYKTNSLSKLNTIHKLTHSNVKAFQCDVCQKAFKNQKQVRNHKRIHRQDVVKQQEACEFCPKTFSSKRRLRTHLDSVHKKLKPFLCSYCGYKGSCKASLRMHIRSHTGEKPFSCDQCPYTTADHNSLRRHKLRHTGHKPYKCSYCPYACIQSSTYKLHLKTKHPGLEKDLMFACGLCQFRTVNKDMYTNHLATVHKEKGPSTS